MKNLAPLGNVLLLAALLGLVLPLGAQTARPAAPAAPEAAAEEELQVIGVVRPWAGGLMGLAIEGNAFVLRFYNAKKEPVEPPHPRAWARWNPVQKAGQQRAVLNRGDEMNSLRSPSVVHPPHVFIVTITLMADEDVVAATTTFDVRELKK